MTDNNNDNTPDSNLNDEVETIEDKPMSSKQFNQALSARERAFEKRLAKQQEDFNKILERLAPPVKEEPQLSRLAEVERTNKELSKRLQERDDRDRSETMRKVTERSLRAHGIDAEFTDHALAYLIDAKKAIKYDEDGNVVMVLNGMTYDDLDEGMAAWSLTKDAKLYRKPTAAQGSGDGNRRNALESMKKSGTLDLKRREDADKTFTAENPKTSLDRSSRAALNQILIEKLSKR